MDVPGSQQLLDLIGRRPSVLELDHAALELAAIEYPDLNPLDSLRELDRIAFAIADRATDLSDGECFVETANRYIFGELGFTGDTTDYYRADNSCLNRVLETRTGIPLTLSLVYMEVARRLAKPVSGIGLPGHFVVRYQDEKYSVFIDPYHGGGLLDESGWLTSAKISNENPDLRIVVIADEWNDHTQDRLDMVGADHSVCRRDGAEALAMVILGKASLSEAV